jgi:hypothetical protein
MRGSEKNGGTIPSYSSHFGMFVAVGSREISELA